MDKPKRIHKLDGFEVRGYTFWITEDDREFIRRDAGRLGISMAKYFRDLIKRRRLDAPPIPHVEPIISLEDRG